MSVLFGGVIADELAEIVRKSKEEFDRIDIDSHFKHKQWKNKSKEFIIQQQQEQHIVNKQVKSEVSKSITKTINNTNDVDNSINSFINTDESDEEEESNNEIEYLDVREQTIFRYSNRRKISKYDRKKNAKKSSLAYIQNGNVRTSYKNDLNEKKKIVDNVTHFAEDPFMNQKLLRQNFMIDRGKRNGGIINDKSKISKLARNNLQFIKEVLTQKQIEMKKNLLFDKRRFNRKLRFSLGAPNKRRQRNYKEFLHMMKKRQVDFEDKKDLFLERGLRVQTKLNNKVLFSKYGRHKVWNAGRTKMKKGKRRNGKIGGYEFAKNINDW
eukprot:512211_1